jgi:Ca2+-binding RTX toxin-like protein
MWMLLSVILLLTALCSISSLSQQVMGTTASDSQSSITLPGVSISSRINEAVSFPGISLSNLDLPNDRNIFGNIGNIVGNISDIISEIGDRGCVIDSIRGGSSDVEEDNALIIGTNCDDTIEADNKDNIIYAKGGDDLVYSEAGNDIVFGGTGSDRLYGGNDDDLMMGGAGNVLVDGGNGNDVILPGAGEGLLVGGDGNDKIFAGPVNTIMYGGKGADTFDCPLPVAGLARSIVMDYNPTNGDTLTGQCKVMNTIGNSKSGDISSLVLPDTQDSEGSSNSIIPNAITPPG